MVLSFDLQLSRVKGNTQQSRISGPKVRGGGPLFSEGDPLITRRESVNDTTPEMLLISY